MSAVGMHIEANVDRVRTTVAEAAARAGRDPSRITIVAATKFVQADRLQQAYRAGLRAFGENRLQEAQRKMSALSHLADIHWHFIGRLQRRKLKAITGRFALIHSVESVEQAELINRWAAERGIQQPILLEVNVGQEPTKGGFSPSALWDALSDLARLTHVAIQGLMTVPPIAATPEAARPFFRALRSLAEAVNRAARLPRALQELSMGMSHDYPVAIEEGATIVRIGTAIFGPRQSV
ncbi:MAG: YggS family pyridoxal phosphate-dependent enzyme [Nitrospirae bacterium]|nr:MAG: YggS family pyridoxal phosphate-dependent enzyme [Nitrospirota bacterium]